MTDIWAYLVVFIGIVLGVIGLIPFVMVLFFLMDVAADFGEKIYTKIRKCITK